MSPLDPNARDRFGVIDWRPAEAHQPIDVPRRVHPLMSVVVIGGLSLASWSLIFCAVAAVRLALH